ncbi:MAG: STAS domain-containing protein [Planctomycetes bacterium]|nr:STAS domain-containing protein [Planctomycetota bacterium]
MKNKDINDTIQQVRNEERALVVSLGGEVDLRHSSELQHSLSRLLDETPGRMVLDLSQVTYMDSSGIASLIKMLGYARQKNIALMLCGLTDRVKGIFEITRLDKVFGIYSTVEEAMA